MSKTEEYAPEMRWFMDRFNIMGKRLEENFNAINRVFGKLDALEARIEKLEKKDVKP